MLLLLLWMMLLQKLKLWLLLDLEVLHLQGVHGYRKRVSRNRDETLRVACSSRHSYNSSIVRLIVRYCLVLLLWQLLTLNDSCQSWWVSSGLDDSERLNESSSGEDGGRGVLVEWACIISCCCRCLWFWFFFLWFRVFFPPLYQSMFRWLSISTLIT